MKLKMAEKSLFALLLRSPWWVSFCLVALFGLASKALLPDQYVVYGVMGGFPFVVIGLIAAWRQWQAPSATFVSASLQQAAGMSWRDFANALERGFKGQGYAVTRVTTGAADFRLEKSGRTTFVSARRWKAALPGIEPLREVLAFKDAQGADLCSFVSLNPLTANALGFARKNNVAVISGVDLARLIAT